MLANLLHSIEWRHAEKSGASEVVVLVDDSFAEALKWNLEDAHVSPNYLVLPLAVDDSATNQIRISNALRFVVFTSKLSMSVAFTISNMLQSVDATECCIFSSASPESVEFTSFSGTKAISTPTNVGYQGLQDFLLPVKTRVTYFPLHTLHLLASNPHDLSNQQVGVGVLASHSSRIAYPLTLSAAAPTSEDIQNSRTYESILDVNVSDLPNGVKTELKALAHDLAGALVFDYDLDVSASIFALGKTSSILGHNILPVLEQLAEQRSASRSSEKRTQSGLALRKHLPHNTHQSGNLQPAALVLIDRTEDLLTPLSAGSGPTPLAHRIVNTLNYCQYLPKVATTPTVGENGRNGCKYSVESLQCDVSLQCPLLETVSADVAVQMLGMGATEAARTLPKDSNWNVPMSALANLPLQITPSLLYKPDSTHNVLEGIFSQSEEAGRAAICNELKAHIHAESGALPPHKKRGLGAEMLAYTQALIVAPGCSKEKDERVAALSECLGYSPATCTRNQALLSLSLAVVEAMQRSSGKQFTSLCAWQCAYDVRSARESELDGIARKYEDFDICVAHLSTLFLPKNSLPSDGTNSGTNSAINSPPRGSTGLSRVGSAKSVVSEKEASPTAGPVDVVHILVQLLRLVSMFRQRMDSSKGNSNIGSSFNSLTQCLCDYLLLKSPIEELQYLKGLHFLTQSTVEEIQTHRVQSEQLDSLFAAQIQAAEGANTLVEDPQNRIENIELVLKQIRSSVLDQLTYALQGIHALQQLYNAQKSALFEISSNSSGNAASVLSRKTSTNECLDLLNTADDSESIGLVARIARAYLTERGGSDNSADPLVEMLEFIETPLQKMKRAGLGLLSKGLGSLGFGFGSQVASSAVSTPQPSDQPVLVLFVLGGISYKEVGQVQQLLSHHAVPKTKIIVLSTRIVNAENVLYTFFTS